LDTKAGKRSFMSEGFILLFMVAGFWSLVPGNWLLAAGN
jgi:hypothetical protein